MRSVVSVGLGILLATLIGFLIVFGVLAPVLSVVFGLGSVAPAGLLSSLLLVFSVGFAFYFGGMAAAYHARFRRRLHGVLVGVIACAISPVVNLLSGNGAFPNVDSIALAIVLVLVLVAAVGASYIGAKRGEALYAFNRQYSASRKPAKKRRRRPSSENGDDTGS
ncbi:MAG: hypothetical protein ACR2KW_08800 [Rubrobacter sp.]